jgi:hypothetical protein
MYNVIVKLLTYQSTMKDRNRPVREKDHRQQEENLQVNQMMRLRSKPVFQFAENFYCVIM